MSILDFQLWLNIRCRDRFLVSLLDIPEIFTLRTLWFKKKKLNIKAYWHSSSIQTKRRFPLQAKQIPEVSVFHKCIHQINPGKWIIVDKMALLQINIGTMQFLANYVQHRKSSIMSDTVLQRECTLNRNYLGLILSWQTCHVLTNLMQRNLGKN